MLRPLPLDFLVEQQRLTVSDFELENFGVCVFDGADQLKSGKVETVEKLRWGR